MEEKPKSSDEPPVEYKQIVEIQIKVNELLNEFKQLTNQLEQANEVIRGLTQKEQDAFFNWNTKFEQLVKNAQECKLIAPNFITKHQTYTVDEWNKDLDWWEAKSYFEQQDNYSSQINNLQKQMQNLENFQHERTENYRLIAKLTTPTIVIPLLLELIYLADKYITNYQLSQTEEKKSKLADLIAKHKFPISQQELLKRSFYYSSGSIGTEPFFSPLFFKLNNKEAKDEEKLAPSPKPLTPGNTSSKG